MTAVERRTVVPWVVGWSAQQDALNASWDVRWSPAGLITPGWPQLFGFTWKFYPSLYRGQGRPLFSQIDTQRHIQAMRGPRCQVCGVKLPKVDTPWLLTELDMVGLEAGHATTPTAPTCEACWPVASQLCPHLAARGFRPVHVPSYRVAGVAGKLYRRPDDREGKLVQVALDDPERRWVLAAQLLVELEGLT